MNRSAAHSKRLPWTAQSLGIAALAAALTMASGALAQLAPSSGAPVDITADQLEVQNQKCLAIYSGDAEVLQATARLRANVINIYFKTLPPRAADQAAKGAQTGTQTNCGLMDRMEADGSVYYVTPDQVVKGDHGVYNADAKTIVVTGDVVVAQGKNVSSGTHLVINTDTGVANFTSDVTGRGKTGRVRAVLFPNQTQTGAAAAASSGGGLKAPVAPPPRKHGA